MHDEAYWVYYSVNIHALPGEKMLQVVFNQKFHKILCNIFMLETFCLLTSCKIGSSTFVCTLYQDRNNELKHQN